MLKTYEDLLHITAEAARAEASIITACAAYSIEPSAVPDYSQFAAIAALSTGVADPVALVGMGFLAGLVVAHSVPEPGPLSPAVPA